MADTMDKEIMAEAQRQRAHELQLAKINADSDARIAESERLTKAKRLPYLFGAVLAVCIATVASLLISWGVQNTNNDDRYRAQQNERADQIRIQIEQNKASVANACISAGNVWINGDTCIQVAKK